MSKFKPVSAFEPNSSAPAQTEPSTATLPQAVSTPPASPLFTPPPTPAPAPIVAPVDYPVSTQASTALNTYSAPTTSPLERVFSRHQERLQGTVANPEQLRQEVARLVQGFDPRNIEAVHQFGSNAGQNVVRYSDKLLAQVRSKDVDGLGEQLNDVVVLAKGINLKGLLDSSRSKIPLIGGLIDSLSLSKDKVLGRYQTLSRQIENLVNQMKITQTRLANRIKDLENVYTFNRDEYYQLDTFILVGEVKLEELKDEVECQKASPNANEPMIAQAISDLQDVANRLEKRVHDLRTMQMVAVQTAPMIRMVQSNNQQLIDKFRNLQELTIPSWKKQFTLAIALIEQRDAAELSKKIDDTTNELMRRNADLLKQNSINTARANQRSVVDIETLEHVQQTLITTIEEVDRIQREGEQARSQAASRMETMKGELIDRLGVVR